MYGKTIKYVIPEFTPSAIPTSPFSTTALHIAHWADMIDEEKIISKESKYFSFLYIVRRDH